MKTKSIKTINQYAKHIGPVGGQLTRSKILTKGGAVDANNQPIST